MSLKRAETMAVAMESRGFNAAEQRSSFYESTFDWQDTWLTGMAFIFSIMMILAGFIF
jgi:energy-coupling factor transporter transmembrane protein EcfT